MAVNPEPRDFLAADAIVRSLLRKIGRGAWFVVDGDAWRLYVPGVDGAARLMATTGDVGEMVGVVEEALTGGEG